MTLMWTTWQQQPAGEGTPIHLVHADVSHGPVVGYWLPSGDAVTVCGHRIPPFWQWFDEYCEVTCLPCLVGEYVNGIEEPQAVERTEASVGMAVLR